MHHPKSQPNDSISWVGTSTRNVHGSYKIIKEKPVGKKLVPSKKINHTTSAQCNDTQHTLRWLDVLPQVSLVAELTKLGFIEANSMFKKVAIQHQNSLM